MALELTESDLDLLLDRLLDRFLRRLEADDWVAWLALDDVFTSHAPSLEWPEVKEALAEYRRTGKVTRREVELNLYRLKATGRLEDAEGNVVGGFGEEGDDQVEE